MPIHNYCKNQSKRIVSDGKNNSDIQIGQGSTPVMARYIHIYAWMYNKMQSESAVPPIKNLIWSPQLKK